MKDFWRLIVSPKYAVFASLALVGVALIFMGYALKQDWLTAIGGAVLGSSISAFISYRETWDFRDKIQGLLTDSLRQGFSSNHEALQKYKIKYHLYHVSRKDAKDIWWHSIVDFSESLPVDKLLATTVIIGTDNKEIRYRVEGGLRDQRLVLFREPVAGSEPCAVYVFPEMDFDFNGKHCGVIFHMTWDKKDAICSAIITDKALFNREEIGQLPDGNASELDQMWTDESRKSTLRLLPRVTFSPAKNPSSISSS